MTALFFKLSEEEYNDEIEIWLSSTHILVVRNLAEYDDVISQLQHMRKEIVERLDL